MKLSLFASRRGMTLAEMMVSIGAGSMVMASMAVVYMACAKIASGTMGQLDIQSKARRGLDQVLYDVRKGARATIYDTFQGAVNADAGAYMVVQIPTNSIVAPDQPYHHYYVGKLKTYGAAGSGMTNGSLYFFTSTDGVNLSGTNTQEEVMRGITNPDHVFDWINGVVNINIRVADENDVNGKQIIYLRSAVAFRNGP